MLVEGGEREDTLFSGGGGGHVATDHYILTLHGVGRKATT